MGSKFLGLNVPFFDKIKNFCRLKLGFIILDELRAGSCYFLYLTSVLFALQVKDFSDLFFFLGVLSESACFWCYMFVDLF